MLIIPLEIDVKWPILSDFTQTLSTIKLEFNFWHIVSIGGIAFSIKLPNRNLFGTVLDFLGNKLDLLSH
jgi:hypothetical protein